MAPACNTHIDVNRSIGRIEVGPIVEFEGDGSILVERILQRGSLPDSVGQCGDGHIGRSSQLCGIAYLETGVGRDGLLAFVLESNLD